LDIVNYENFVILNAEPSSIPLTIPIHSMVTSSTQDGVQNQASLIPESCRTTYNCPYPGCIRVFNSANHAANCCHSFWKPGLDAIVAEIMKKKMNTMISLTSKHVSFSQTLIPAQYSVGSAHVNLSRGYSKKSSAAVVRHSKALKEFIWKIFKYGQNDDGSVNHSAKATIRETKKELTALVNQSLLNEDGIFVVEDDISEKQIASLFSSCAQKAKKVLS
jgi:hypothetical protein